MFRWIVDEDGDHIKKYANHTRSFLIFLACSLGKKEYYKDIYLKAYNGTKEDKKLRIPRAEIACRHEVADKLPDFKSKHTKPGRIGRNIAKSIEQNYLLKSSSDFRKMY